MKNLIIATIVLLSSIASAATNKTFYVRNSTEIDTEKSIVVVKEIGAYRIFKLCDLTTYLYKSQRNEKLDLDNPVECTNIGNGTYKYNQAGILAYKNKILEEHRELENIETTLVASTATTASIVVGRLLYHLFHVFDMNELRKDKKALAITTLFSIITGVAADIVDDYADEKEFLANVLTTATSVSSESQELSTPMTMSEYANMLNEVLILGGEQGIFETVEID